MTERIPIYGPVDVTTSDGVTFRCSREEVPSPCLPGDEEFATTESRWVFVASAGARYIGPPAAAASHLDSLQRMVDEWWMEQREIYGRGRG
jgi:hypothetical protein